MAESTINIGGTQKSITDGYINVGGTLKRLVRGYQNVGGVLVPLAIFKRFVWKKYAVESTNKYDLEQSSSYTPVSFTKGTKYTFYMKCAAGSSGLSLSTSKSLTAGTDFGYSISEGVLRTYPYYKSGNTVYKYTQNISTSTTAIKLRMYTMSAKETVTQSRGDYIEDVSSAVDGIYPDDGIHTDGYWYVKQ